jgi:hypothetical protein
MNWSFDPDVNARQRSVAFGPQTGAVASWPGRKSAQTVLAVGAVCVMSVFLTAAGHALAQDAAPAQIGAAPAGSAAPATPAVETKIGPQKPSETARDNDAHEALCLMLESAAAASNLPLEFFARVIWQESRFQPDAIGPVTHNGQRALGIAQFMPGTANERRLLDPLDPVQALPKSAEFLNELRNQFGNLGLAAAAYNAGPRRVQEWLAGSGNMPQETRNYVVAITGTSVDDWAAASKNGKISYAVPNTGCRELIALFQRGPNSFVSELAQRVTGAIVKPWGVQVATGFNRDNAFAMYARAMKGVSAVKGLQDDPSLVPLLFRSPGTSSFYQVRIGTGSRREADDLCGHIRRAGGACLVKQNRRQRGSRPLSSD